MNDEERGTVNKTIWLAPPKLRIELTLALTDKLIRVCPHPANPDS